jgi:flagellar basal body rod protein FlgG
MAVYTRQSSSGIVDGGVIEASDLNAEFDQLASAFLQPTFGTGAAGTDIALTFDGETNDGIITWMEDEDYFQFSDDILMTTTEKVLFRDSAIYLNSSTDGQLDIVADTEVQIAATTIDINGNVDVSGTLTVAGAVDFGDAALSNVGAVQLDSIAGDADTNTSITFSGSDVITVATGGSTAFTVNASQLITASGGITSTAASNTFGATSFNDADITNVGSIALDTITNDGTDVTIDSGGDIVLDAGGADVTLKDDGTTFGSLSQSSGELVIKSGSTPTTAITMSGANVTVAGDLTVSGDDITMGTNTAGNLLIADGTNFNSVAVGSLSEISTVANDDVFLAVDTSGGGLKKITRSAIVSGLATSSAISNVSEDSTPQLGGDLDVNGNDIVSVSNGNINLLPNGSGKVIMDGNGSSGGVSITDGVIDIRTGTGNEAKILFYCESSNAHAQTLQAAPHSASSSATLVLPTASGTLIGTGDTGTLPVAAIDIDGATDIGADIVDADLFIIDDGAGGTNRKVAASRIKSYVASATAADDIGTGDAAVTIATSSGNITLDAQAGDTDIIFKGTDGSSDTTFLTLDGSDAGTAIFNHDIKIADDGQIGSASAADAMIISSGGIVTFKDDILIKDGGTIGVASDADSITIASDGVVTMNQIPVFSAGINVSGGSIAGTLSTAAQANITSLGTLTALTVDDVNVNGKVITMTGSTDDTAVFTAGTNGTLTIETTDTAAAAANIQITADGTFEVDATTITLDSAGDIALDAAGNNVTFKSGGTSILDFSNSSSDAVITSSVQDKDIIFKGDDGGSAVTPLTMDMSAAGKLLLGAGAVGSTLTDTSNSGSITLDFDTYQNFVLTATGNITLANPSTESVGQSGIIVLIQDGTGSRTLSLGTDYETAGGAGLTISTAASAVDVIPYFVKASGSIQLGAPQLAFA